VPSDDRRSGGVGDAASALARLHGIWPCVDVDAARDTGAGRLAVVAQRPVAGTRVPAFGVMVGRGYRPTTVAVTLAAR
jgi:hypothetical protein